MQTIVLPEPENNIWLCIQPILVEISRLLNASVVDCFSLGGGKILTSRWTHRQSSDIDILVQQGRGIGIGNLIENDFFKTLPVFA